jgi:hypothetical protein
MAMNDMDKKTEYLVRELWILAWNASVQHASLYKAGAWQNQRDQVNAFKRKVIDYIRGRIIPQYKEAVDGLHHCENIRSIIAYANEVDAGVLGKNGYKYGVAQKVLNLALKYYWCLGQIKEPPHCPVDKIVIDKTSFRGKVNWTQILTEKEYLDIISAIRALAEKENSSIAQWELDNYERRQS